MVSFLLQPPFQPPKQVIPGADKVFTGIGSTDQGIAIFIPVKEEPAFHLFRNPGQITAKLRSGHGIARAMHAHQHDTVIPCGDMDAEMVRHRQDLRKRPVIGDKGAEQKVLLCILLFPGQFLAPGTVCLGTLRLNLLLDAPDALQKLSRRKGLEQIIRHAQ